MVVVPGTGVVVRLPRVVSAVSRGVVPAAVCVTSPVVPVTAPGEVDNPPGVVPSAVVVSGTGLKQPSKLS